MNKIALRAVTRHAVESYPHEACGLLIRENGRRVYVPCRNLAANPGEQFRLCPEDFAAAEDRGPVLAVVHSHPDAPAQPSEADRVGCEASGLPWYILSVVRGEDGQPVAGELIEHRPTGYRAPLVGRSFLHGVLDCWTLVRDFYSRELGIDLPNFEREDEWWLKGQSLYEQHLGEAGFSRVYDLRHGDLIVMQIRAPVPNHGAIYLATGKLDSEPEHYPAPGAILHHLYHRDSTRDVYGGYWAESTAMVMRHKDSPHA